MASAQPVQGATNMVQDIEGGNLDKIANTALTNTRTFVDGSSTTTKLISCILVFGYVISTLFPQAVNFLALIPDRTLPDVWNVVTGGFFETTFFALLVDATALMALGRILEPIWGATEFIKFISVVNLAVGCTTFTIMYILYIVTRDTFYLMATFGGFHGVIAGLLVAVRQLTPEEQLIPTISIRAKHYLWIYIVSTAILCILSGAQHHHIGLYLYVLSGVYIGWLYLRYFQVTAAGVGDPSDEFGFDKLFPEALQPIVGRLAAIFHKVFCTPVQPPTHVAAQKPAIPGVVEPGAGPADAPANGQDGKKHKPMDPERRREVLERGNKLLEERLAASGISDGT